LQTSKNGVDKNCNRRDDTRYDKNAIHRNTESVPTSPPHSPASAAPRSPSPVCGHQ
jgi:hypothetical protein